MIAIYKRETKAYFTSMLSYIFLAAFFAMEGFLFYFLYKNGSNAVYAIPLDRPLFLTVFLLPMLTMRSMSEDRRQKVDQVLLTAPIPASSVVLGKFFACLTVFGLAYAPTLLFELIVAYHCSVNWLLYLYAMLGTCLIGAALIAIGIFISSLTESTALSAVLSVVVNLFIVFASSLASIIGVDWVTNAAKTFALVDRYAAFGESIFSLPDIVFFLTVIAVFLFLCVRSVERRRWA